ncbi:uncharacterized protein SRS1_25033 [Sporisorium reilianum f. sp. reilianum]|uniref:DDE Tnp4 domain-containing protein n=1 Tax=Sporisorium reilianum f. sp. reilianum TaxID=72559 RepID=A0A2N8UGP6_9BASI|nr:uncharacterized protein SRS1_25033 [Sporisorium reilianum f. sp. reilianum]
MPSQQPLFQLSLLALAAAISHFIFNVRDNKQLLIKPCSYLDLKEMLDNHFKDNFGFEHSEFDEIHAALKLPELIKTNVQDTEDSHTALLMLLGYLRGRTLRGLESQFGWSKSRISRVRSEVANQLLTKWGHLLDVHHNTLLSKQCLKSTPDGLIFAQGPWDGSENNWSVWTKSGVADWLQNSSFTKDNRTLYLFGDKGYHLDHHLIVPYKGNNMKPKETWFNVIMSKYRITVEWAIGLVSVLFPWLNNKQQQKFLLMPVANNYLIGVILWNALSCLKGNTTSQYFDLPSLDMYFRENVQSSAAA